MTFTRLGTINTGSNGNLRFDARANGNIIVRSSNDGEWITNLDANGVRTTIVAFSPSGGGQTLRSGDIHALTGGGFIVDGTIFSGGGAGTYVMTYSAAGVATSSLLTPSDEPNGDPLAGRGYVVTPTSTGGFALTWTDTSQSGVQQQITYGQGTVTRGQGTDVRIRYFDDDGDGLGGSVLAAQGIESIMGASTSRLTSDQSLYDSTRLTNGSVAYVYADTRWIGQPDNGTHTELEITLQVSGGSGNPGQPVRVDQGIYNEVFGVDPPHPIDGANGANVVALATGGVAVVWQENSYAAAPVFGGFLGNGINTFIRFFDANGVPVSDGMQLLHREAGLAQVNTYVYAEAMPDGRVALAWHEYGTFDAPFTQHINAYAGSVGISGVLSDVQLITPAPATAGQDFLIQDMAVATDGTVNIAYWQNNFGSTQIARFATDLSTGGLVYHSTISGDVYYGTGGDDLVTGIGGNDNFYGFAGNDRLVGSAGTDTLFGGDGNDVLEGGDGDDMLIGQNGEDRLVGGAGLNTLIGGAGNDTYAVASTGDSIAESAGGGTDTVQTTLFAYTLASELENLTFDDSLAHVGIGNAGDNIITGSSAGDTLIGNGGNDRLVGGSGAANTMLGGTGNDTYVLAGAGDTVLELANEGVDSISTTAGAYVLSANFENLYFTDGAAHTGIGNASDNIIGGGTGAANTLIGGVGNDTYIVSATGDSVIELGGEGTDSVQANIGTYVLAANVENLSYTGTGAFTGIGNGDGNAMTGGASGDFLSGLAGNDVLNGAGGNDVLFGGDGADRFQVGSLASGADRILDFTSGTDTIGLANGIAHTANISLVQGSGSQVATTANSTFLYNNTTGELFYDADGTGGGAAVSVAVLNTGLTLAAGDFVFV